MLGSEAAELDLVAEALATDWGLADVEFPVQVLAGLSPAIAAGERSVTVVLHDRRTVLDIRPGYSDEAWGVAVDVGSTTIAGYLLELSSGEVAATSGRMNPQIRFGEDLMSRVSYVMMNPGGEADLTAAVRGCHRRTGGRALRAGRRRPDPGPRPGRGREPDHAPPCAGPGPPPPLGAAPFTLTTASAVRGRATDIGCRSSAGCGTLHRSVHRRACGSGRPPRSPWPRGPPPGCRADAGGGCRNQRRDRAG